MREWCGCGAGVHSFSYARVQVWRREHVCPPREDTPQVPQTGAESKVELSYADIDMTSRAQRIGFIPKM